jgi:myosin heavy subunit
MCALAGPLLRRSRVVSIKSPERSYHIFYQLCAGANEEQREVLRCAGLALLPVIIISAFVI